MGNRKGKVSNILYGFKRNTNGASIALKKVDKPKRTNGTMARVKKTKV